MVKYILTSTVYYAKKQLMFYGIALVKVSSGKYELIKKYNDISENKQMVESFVDNCNKLKLDETLIDNIIEDLLNI